MAMERKLAAKEMQAQTDEIRTLKRRLAAANNSVSAYAALPTPIHLMSRDRFLPGEPGAPAIDLLDLPDDDEDAIFTWNGLYSLLFPPAPSNLHSYDHAKVLKV